MSDGSLLSAQDQKNLPVLFWQQAGAQYEWASHNRPSYVLSPDLAEMLQHTRLDQLPVDGLRLPYPAIVLAPPEGISTVLFGKPGCLYVSDYVDEDVDGGHYCWHVRFSPDEQHFSSFPLGHFVMDVPGQTVEDAVEAEIQRGKNAVELWKLRAAVSPAMREYVSGYSFLPAPSEEVLRNTLLFVCACMVYATMPDADILLAENSPEYAAWLKTIDINKLGRRDRREFEGIRRIGGSRRFYLGRQIKIIDRHQPNEDSGHEKKGHMSPRLHWRSGHYRRVWHGSGQDRHTQVHWIKPTLVGMPQGGNVLERRAGMR
jgi:hypothetical protein